MTDASLAERSAAADFGHIVRLEGVQKFFGAIQALRDIDFAVGKNEIVGLIGDNGAGKSTLIKVLTGVLAPTSGRIFVRDRELDLADYSVRMAHDLSIETVYQDKSLAEKQPLWRNFFVGRQITNRWGFIDIRQQKAIADRILKEAIGFRGAGISVDSTVANLSGGERQGIAIGRAMHYDADLIVLDEPTVALAVAEVRKVLDFVRRIKELGESLHLHRPQPRACARGRRPAGDHRPRQDRRRSDPGRHVGDRADRVPHRPPARGLTMATREPSRLSKIEGLPIILVFVALLGLFMYAAPRVFLQPFIYTTFLSTLPPLVLLAVGLTFVIGAGEIDLSFPAIIAFSGFVFAVLFKEYELGWLAVLAGVGSGLLVGYLNGVIVARIGIPSFMATLATQFFWVGMATVLSGGKSYALRGAEESSVWRVIVGRPFAGSETIWIAQLPLQALWTALIVVVLWFILNRHKFGDSVLFIGDSNAVSRVVGIDVEREKIRIFTLMGGLAGIAAIMLTLENKNYFGNQGQGYLLTAIASVLIGGTSIFGGKATVIGTVFGCFIIGMIEAGLVATGLTGAWVRTVQGLVFLIAVVSYLYIEEPQRRNALFARLRSSRAFGRARAAE